MIDIAHLRVHLEREEGLRRVPYKDTRGIFTIGIGHNLNKQLSNAVIDLLFQEDVTEALDGLNQYYPWWQSLDPIRQLLLIDLTFNLGILGLTNFKQTMRWIEIGAKALSKQAADVAFGQDRKSTRLNSSHIQKSRMPSSA